MITFSGLATGLDTDAIISGILGIEKQPITRLQQKQSDLNSQEKKFTDIKGLLQTLRDAVKNLDSTSDINTSKASSSDEDILTVSGTATGAQATYNVTVNQLASAERTYSDGFASKSDLVGAGTLQISVGGAAAVDVDTDSSDTLSDLADKINEKDAGVTASIIFDGTDYRLQVTGNDTGADNYIDFTEGGSLDVGLDVAANQKVQAKDATLDIDGLTVTSSTNKFQDAVAGLQFEAVKVSTTPVSVTVGADNEDLESKLATFVDSYNAVIKSINKEFTYAGVSRGANTLFGDTTLRNLQRRLGTAVTSAVEGLSGNYTTLSSIGITSNNDGTLKLNKTALADALEADPDGVSALLAEDTGAGTVGVMAALNGDIDDFVRSSDGAIAVRISGIKGQVREIDDQIEHMNDRLDKREETLRKQFTAMETLVGGLQAQGNALASMLFSLGQ